MKIKKPSKKFLSISLGIICVIVVVIYNIHYYPSRSVSTADNAVLDVPDNLPPIDPEVSEELPHNRYKQLTDSIRSQRNIKNANTGAGMSVAFIGVVEVIRCDTCSLREYYSDKQKLFPKEYFLKLPWWQLDTLNLDEPIIYHFDNGQAYLRKTVCKERPVKGQLNTQYFSCIEKDIPVKFRYDIRDSVLLIPISKTTYDIMWIVLNGFFGIILLYAFYLTFSFCRLVISIATGEPFTERNVKRLKIMAIILIVPPILYFLLNLSMRLIFNTYFTEDIILSAISWKVSQDSLILIVIAVALYFAFKRARKLKTEQEFTI